MTKQETIDEISRVMCHSNNYGYCLEMKTDCNSATCRIKDFAEALYDMGYRKTFTSEMASDTQKAYKEGYLKSYDDIIFLVKKAIIANARANVWTDTMVMDMDDVDNIAEEVAEKIGGLNNDERRD